MRRRLIAILVIAALGGCGKGDTPVAGFTLTSKAFKGGRPIPAAFTCDGARRPPPLAWTAPPDTNSFALVVDDPDAPGGTFGHWGWFDIPPSVRSDEPQAGGSQAINDFGHPGYGAPCPPKSDPPHHYRFNLYALKVDHLNLGPNAKVRAVDAAAQQQAIARADLIGTYQRR
jgi:Raf kinase inhibitor-like YbhB/YbcL family protein